MRILRDPRIAGYAATPVYKRREDGKLTSTIESYRIERDPETMKPVQAYPPIIPPDEWHELQKWLDGGARARACRADTPSSPPWTSCSATAAR